MEFVADGFIAEQVTGGEEYNPSGVVTLRRFDDGATPLGVGMHCDTIPRVVPTLGWKMKSRWDFLRAIPTCVGMFMRLQHTLAKEKLSAKKTE
jgi:hypothetical protein